MPKLKNSFQAKCPYCKETHIAKKAYAWTGHGTPRIECRTCEINRRSAEHMQREQKGSGKKHETMPSLKRLSETRGLPVEDNIKRANTLERMGRELRGRYGVKAPANWYVVRDSYHGQYGGVY